MEEEFLLITTLFKWTTTHSLKLQTSCTYSVDVMYNDTLFVNIYQLTTVQATVISFHLHWSMIQV